MRFEAAQAHAFGPFRGETLELGCGMNVVFGPNEAGKSSWHAALYAGLCGVRRGPGLRREEREFAARHKPWDGEEWEVGAVVALGDGRRVELRHDLAGKVESSALDAGVAGRDYSDEILFDGAPDGSRWLGLNRRTFLATACVRQADILRVRDQAGALQEDMQRAAATAGADATAAAALQRLEDVLRERVGSTRAPTKPLIVSERRLAGAHEALGAAQEAYRDFRTHRSEMERLEEAAAAAELRTAGAEAVLARADADALAERLREARALHERFPAGAPHAGPEGGGLAAVIGALTKWDDLPAPVELTEPSARDIEERIATADAGLAAARAVAAETAGLKAETRLARVRDLLPLFPEGGPRGSPEEDARLEEVRQALHAFESLSEAEPPTGRSVENIEAELDDLQVRRETAAAEPTRPSGAPWLVGGAIAVVGGTGLALLVPELRAWGFVLFAAGVVGVVVRLWPRRSGSARADDSQIALALDLRRDTLTRELKSARSAQKRYDADLRARRKAVERLRELADADDADSLEAEALAESLRRRLESARAARAEAVQRGAQWDELQGLLAGSSADELTAETNRLRQEADHLLARADERRLAKVRDRGITRGEVAELERWTQARRREWSNQRANRLAAEELAARRAEAVADAGRSLREAGERVGVRAEDDSGLAHALETWRADRERALEKAGERAEAWDSLQRLLGERTLDQLDQEVEQRRLRATHLMERIGDDAVAEARARQPTEEALESFRLEERAARAKVQHAAGQLAAREQRLPSVADAEDALAATERERERILRLKDTLDHTIGFLREAEDRVMRDIAPRLMQTVLEWLPTVTDGRYTGCRVDPSSLLIEARTPGGRWRDAELLSHGTTEQVYLLLRFALSRHLTTTGEACPLILDDVVAASDAERKEAVLRTLQALAESTQVILFTHEEDVRAWADRNLAEPDGRLIELGGPRRDAG